MHLQQNDLYVKPEKYMWKMQKMNFLEVLMGQGKIVSQMVTY